MQICNKWRCAPDGWSASRIFFFCQRALKKVFSRKSEGWDGIRVHWIDRVSEAYDQAGKDILE